MITFQPKPAIIQMLDHRRGDLFAVVADDQHYVVIVKEPLDYASLTIGKFMPGTVGIGENDEPVVIHLDQSLTPVPCKPLTCSSYCSDCGGPVDVVDNAFRCAFCEELMKD